MHSSLNKNRQALRLRLQQSSSAQDLRNSVQRVSNEPHSSQFSVFLEP